MLYYLICKLLQNGMYPSKIVHYIVSNTAYDENQVKLVLYKSFNIPLVNMRYTTHKMLIDQKSFRNRLIGRFNSCIITDMNAYECEACYIIQYNENDNYDVENGLLLNRCIYKLFDAYIWSINPKTMCVEVDSRHTDKSIYKYAGKQLTCLTLGNLYFLQYHYNIFSNKINKI